MRGARVQHNGIGIGDEAYRFDGCRVRQTENRDIRAVQRVAAGFRVLSGFFRERDKSKFLTAFEPLTDSQSGGARTSVDKNLSHSCLLIKACPGEMWP